MDAKTIKRIAEMNDEELAFYKKLVAFLDLLGVDETLLPKIKTVLESWDGVVGKMNENLTAMDKDIKFLEERVNRLQTSVERGTASREEKEPTLMDEFNMAAEVYKR